MRYLFLFALVTINLDTGGQIVHPTEFMLLTDCRAAGDYSISLAALFGGRAGYMCVEMNDD